MGARPWFPFYVGDYLRDTTALDAEEHGAYLMLLLAYWIRGGPLPDDDKILATTAKISKWKWKNFTRASLSQFFQVRDGLWHHKRMEKELAKALKIGGVTSSRAREAARARWSKRDALRDASSIDGADASSMLEPMLQHAQPQPQSQRIDSFGDVSKEQSGERRVLGNFDFVSDDGSVLVTAEEFAALEAELTSVKNIRGVVRDACRRWLLDTQPAYRKETLLRWLRRKNAENMQRQSPARREDAKESARRAVEADVERRRQADKALAVQERLNREHQQRMEARRDQIRPGGELSPSQDNGSH